MTASQSNDRSSDTATTESRGVALSAWFLYVLIVFEIIFMVSPAALYYYSAYGLPLNALASHPYTSWLVQYILPHFSYHQSTLAAVMIMVSWPLILLGLLIFIWGFVQIYVAKFTKAGPVTTGLYRFIRHPQYTGLAIAGLGTAFFWSRFLVVLTYITMLFLYVLLARNEETRCRNQFGEPYEKYLAETGRFLPRKWLKWLPLPTLSAGRLLLVYVVSMFVAITGGFVLKHHVIAQMNVATLGNLTVVIVAPIDQTVATRAIALAKPDIENSEPRLAYLVPEPWSIPELGIQPTYEIEARDELAHPMLHGNLPEYEGHTFNLLVMRPLLRTPTSTGLANVIGSERLYLITVDVQSGATTKTKQLSQGKWEGIPVPVY